MDIENLLKLLNEHDVCLTKKILIRQYIVETDIYPFVAGVTFDVVWENKLMNNSG